MKKILLTALLLAGFTAVAQERLDANTFKESVLEYSQDLKASQAEYQAVVSAIKYAKSAYYPAISGAGTFRYSLKDRNYSIPTTQIFFPMEREDFALGAELTQPIYAGGAINSSVKSAKLKGQVAEKQVELTSANIAHGADLAYWGAVAQKAMYGTMEEYVKIVTELRDIVEVRYKEGKIAKTDYIQIESRLAEAKMQLIDSKTYYELAIQNLNIMMGRDPYTPIELADALDSQLTVPASINPGDVLDFRPEVKIAELGIQLQEQKIKGAAAAYNPSLYAGLSETWGSASMNVNNKGYWGHALYVKLSVPIFNMGARYKSMNVERNRLRASKYELQKQVDMVAKEVTDAWTKINENVEKIKIAKDNVAVADENLDLNTFSYNEGRLTILDVLSAQAAWISAYTSMITVWHSQHVAISDYNKATAYIK